MPAPDRYPLTLPLFQIASPHDRSAPVTGKDPAASFYLVIYICETQRLRHPGSHLHKGSEFPRVHILPVFADVPPAREDETRIRLCEVQDGLGRSRRVPMHSPGNQYRKHTVTPFHGLANHLPVVCSSREKRYTIFEPLHLANTLLPADTDHLITPIKCILKHVLPELSGNTDDADFHAFTILQLIIVQLQFRSQYEHQMKSRLTKADIDQRI